jgi:hypothetical protein
MNLLIDTHTLIWENGIEILPTEFEHFLTISTLPLARILCLRA